MRFLYLFSLVIFYSCSAVMGVTDIKQYSSEDMKYFLQKNKINDSVIYFIDKDYKKELLKISSDTALIKNHLQPLRASYYDKEGKLISFHLNCNAPGFPNLNWNYKNVMEVFPPISQTPVDNGWNLQKELDMIKSNNSSKIYVEEGFDYYIIVAWAGFLKKQSMGLINTVKENLKLNMEEKKVKIIYVCTDNSFTE